MQEQFVPHKFSQILVELGFKEQVIAFWSGRLEYPQNPTTKYLNSDTKAAAILWQQAFDWFRKEYHLFYDILQYEHTKWEFSTHGVEVTDHFASNSLYETYEEARLACLQKLIEIVKTKK